MLLSELTPGQDRAYRRTLRSPGYFKRVRVALLNQHGHTIRNLTGWFQDGYVECDAHQDVTRSSQLTILDPKHDLGFDADTYEGGLLNFTRMVRVWWVTDGPLLDRPVSVPVMTGYVTWMRRSGPIVDIEIQGKEVRGLTPSHRTLHLEQGMKKTDAVKRILRERMGETRLGAIPDLPGKLPDDVVVGPKDLPWKRVLKIARSQSRQAYFDGAGVPRYRRRPKKVSWRFVSDSSGGSGNLTSPVAVESDLREVHNHIRVTGSTPKGKKEPVSATATAERWHTLSPWSLDEDSPVWLEYEESNDHLRTNAECQQLADDLLDEGLRLIGGVSFNAIPVPFLDPGDMIDVGTDYESSKVRVSTFRLPLGTGGELEVGYTDPYTLRKRHGGGNGGGKK